MTLMAVALLGSMIGMLAPNGDLKKYLHLACGICLLCVLAAPVLSLLKNGIPSLDFLWEEQKHPSTNYDEIYQNSLHDGNWENAKNVIKNQILEEFSLPSDSLAVQVVIESKNDIENASYTMKEIRLTLSGEAIFVDPSELSEFVNRTYSCPCVVLYD